MFGSINWLTASDSMLYRAAILLLEPTVLKSLGLLRICWKWPLSSDTHWSTQKKTVVENDAFDGGGLFKCGHFVDVFAIRREVFLRLRNDKAPHCGALNMVPAPGVEPGTY